ncbi:hypothetical protein Ddye_022047 [Dipteronia dyeriana]|uniref:Uncharacterized protein n=1 Tax=Dipteronia dyeriana TaxID=168575 RepID=A0AAD9U2X0_9ROSI|nr:hypothetical protein Ddye_022047 [Dipteronia dyeriana]
MQDCPDLYYWKPGQGYGGGRSTKCEVKNKVFKGIQNGLRLKSWARPSNGFVKGVQFIDSDMQNVQNPIIIDQNYCSRNLNCLGQLRKIQGAIKRKK